MPELEFKVPGPEAPGYLKRQRKAAEFAEALAGESGPEIVDKTAEFLAQFVEGDPELIWEASRQDINKMLAAVRAENLGDLLVGGDLEGEADAGSEDG